jgi:hypothetical protein
MNSLSSKKLGAVEASGAEGWGGSVVMDNDVALVGDDEDMIEQE